MSNKFIILLLLIWGFLLSRGNCQIKPSKEKSKNVLYGVKGASGIGWIKLKSGQRVESNPTLNYSFGSFIEFSWSDRISLLGEINLSLNKFQFKSNYRTDYKNYNYLHNLKFYAIDFHKRINS